LREADKNGKNLVHLSCISLFFCKYERLGRNKRIAMDLHLFGYAVKM